MRKLALAGVFACLIQATVSAQELQPFPQALADPHFLTSHTWKPSSDFDKIVASWSPYTRDQGFTEKTVVKEVKIELLGSTFKAEYRVYKNEPSVEIVLWSTDKDYKSDCPRFRAWTNRFFGKPATAIDRSQPGKQESTIDWTADWLFGQVRVQASCFGVMMGDSFIAPSVVILYRHHTLLKALEDLVYVECSITQGQYVGSLVPGSPPQIAPFTLIIDPNEKRLLRHDKSDFSKVDRYSDEEIVVTHEGKANLVTIRLNRLTGGLLLQTRRKDELRSGSDNWGKCERVSGEKKF